MAKKLFNTNFDNISTEVLKELRINIAMNFGYLQDSDGTIIYDHRNFMDVYMHFMKQVSENNSKESLKNTPFQALTYGEMFYLDLICEIDARTYVIV